MRLREYPFSEAHEACVEINTMRTYFIGRGAWYRTSSQSDACARHSAITRLNSMFRLAGQS
jgi:hypothetical protein